MPRRRKKTNFEEEVIQEAEVITHWSIARIIIAVFILIFIIGGGILGINYFIRQSKTVLGSQTNDKPQIEIPTERRVQSIIEKAKKDLSEIDPKKAIESQPQIQKIINDLQNISGSSNSARRLICESLCQ